MIRALILVAASNVALAAPAAAQHAGHGAPPPASRPPSQAPAGPHAGHDTSRAAASQRPAGAPRPAAPVRSVASPDTQADPHAGHDAAAPGTAPAQAPAADPHAGHDMQATPQAAPSAADPHAGHVMPGVPNPIPPLSASPAAPQQPQSGDPHAGHVMPDAPAGAAPPVAPPPPVAFSGPENAADTIYDLALSRRARQVLVDEHGGYAGWMALADRLEYRAREGNDGYAWDVQGWYGGDYNRLWLKSEGDGAFDEDLEHAEVQALYSRAIDPWFNLQAGVRQDFGDGPERTHLVLGVQGLAPYWFEVDGAVFLSTEGDLTARFEAEYDQRITNRWILQPAVEVDLAAQDVPELGIGAGLTSLEVGLRLRYEFRPEFAPYVGVEYERVFGEAANLRRRAGQNAGEWSLVAGVRTWF